MTSLERKELRYQRRKAKRIAKKQLLAQEHDNFEKVFCYKHLYAAHRRCRRGVAWKSSVQKYVINAPLNVYNTHTQLMTGRFKSPGFYEFDIYERGKQRHIRSTVIGERVVQRCLCDNALVPMLERTFIYDNGASMRNKGYTFAINRLTTHLRKYYRHYGNEGYILLFDFSKFFDNVSHSVVQRIVRGNFSDRRILQISEHFIDAFGDTGLGLGSQISQVLALASANRLDHYIKEVLHIKYYARYMDDGYLIHPSKKYLQECLNRIQMLCDELGIHLNTKKTQIIKISHGFTFLKARFFLLSSGKVVKRIYKRSITRMRIKLKKLRRKLDEGVITFQDVANAWQSWVGYAKGFDAYHAIENMGKLYTQLFCDYSVI